MFDFNGFIKTIGSQFEPKVPEKELRELLDLGENYEKDNPNSTGKYLKICRIKFSGEKERNGIKKKINYDRRLSGGVNVWIADNSKGKSSVFKIIKYALTGRNSLKKDIANWLHMIYLEFKLGEIFYTIVIDMRHHRKKGALLKLTIDELPTEKDKVDDLLIVFKFDSQTIFEQKIEEFFFHQMSFYPLKWTQKSSAKGSLELIESNTSWRTYFKSIYLESKDYGTLFLNKSYGNQEQKILEMILGLKLTYPINRLKIKKDLLENQMAQENISNINVDKQLELIKNIKKELSEVKLKISKIETQVQSQFNNDVLFSKRSTLIDEFMSESTRFETLKEQKVNLQNEINKATRYINNLNEYIEFGSYYNGLEITACPHCDEEISHDKKIAEKDTHTCMVCSSSINKRRDISMYENKLEEQKIQLKRLEESYDSMEIILNSTQQSQNEIFVKANIIENKIKQNNNNELYNEHQQNLNKLREEKGALQKGIEDLETILERNDNVTNKVDIKTKIDVLNLSIKLLEDQRFEESKNIYNRFSELMLNQLSEFGLNSIQKVILDKSLNIKFTQNQQLISFSELNEGEKLRVKIAFFLSLVQLDIEYKVGRHPRFLIIDSPGKEEVIDSDLAGLSKIFKNIDEKYGEKLQVFVGTALREFQYSTIKPEKVEMKEEKKFIF